MRTKEEYLQQCCYLNSPGISESEKVHYSKVYGINRRSILCELEYFDVTKHLPQDKMHVILEGVFPTHIEQLLQYIVHVLSLTTLQEINSCIQSYSYAYFEVRPAPLTSLTVYGKQTGKVYSQL